MRIVMSGATGFLGRPLRARLLNQGHTVVALTRSLPPGREQAEPRGLSLLGWRPEDSAATVAVVDGADAIVNLAGESIAGRRWSDAQKTRIRESRVQTTRSLASAVLAAARPPSVLVSGSATGYYGDTGDRTVDESSPPGEDFLARVCVAWESEAERAAAVCRVALVRTGIVLEQDGGALRKMLPPFRFFAGGPVGSGRQYMSWIHREDWIALVLWILKTSSVSGPFNGTAPNPVTNATFSRALGAALARPSWLPVPGFALRLALGEMADALLLTGQRVLPARAPVLGFRFRYSAIDEALDAIFSESRSRASA